MADRRCKECGQDIPKQLKVPGYHWEVTPGYLFGHWVKDKREKLKNGWKVKIEKENC
jgi:hypothetical protein